MDTILCNLIQMSWENKRRSMFLKEINLEFLYFNVIAWFYWNYQCFPWIQEENRSPDFLPRRKFSNTTLPWYYLVAKIHKALYSRAQLVLLLLLFVPFLTRHTVTASTRCVAGPVSPRVRYCLSKLSFSGTWTIYSWNNTFACEYSASVIISPLN